MGRNGRSMIFFRIFISSFIVISFLLPVFRLRQKKEGAIPCRGSGEAVGCPVRTTEEDAPKGRILHSVPALTVETSYISPEPKRCVERKVLNCLIRIIAKLPPFVGIILRKSEQPICDSAPSSVERADLSSTLYCRRAAKSHAGTFHRRSRISIRSYSHACSSSNSLNVIGPRKRSALRDLPSE